MAVIAIYLIVAILAPLLAPYGERTVVARSSCPGRPSTGWAPTTWAATCLAA
jgi:hypothetical protein